MSDELPEITDRELRERVLYSLLTAVAKFAKRCGFPLDAVKSWLEIAYYHELRRDGLSQKAIADFFEVSLRKVSQLASRLKRNFLKPELEVGLPRKIEYMLWAGPLSEGRIRQALDSYDDQQIADALERLVEQQRVVRRDGRTVHYEVPDSEFRLYRDDWMSRIDGLNNHLKTVVDGVAASFLEDDDDTFARTLNFRIQQQEMDELRRLYEEIIFPRLSELDANARGADDDEETVGMGLSINWTPQPDDESNE